MASLLPHQPLHQCQLPGHRLFSPCNTCRSSAGLYPQWSPLPHLHQRHRRKVCRLSAMLHALYADDIAIWPHQPIYGNNQIGDIQLSNSLRGLSEWAADGRMLFNVKKSCVVLFRNSTRKQNEDSTFSNFSFSISGQQLPIQSSARYRGVMLHSHGHWNNHFDFISPKSAMQ